MKRLMTIAILVIATALPVGAKEVSCHGELYRSTPPVPNYPTHIRNVIWRNAQFLRDACKKQASETMRSGAATSKQEPTRENLR